MNLKKLVIITLISLFALGVLCGTASASHTFHKGKYKLTVTDKQYKKLKTIDRYEVFKKVGYKTKTIYKYKCVKVARIKIYKDKKFSIKKYADPYKKYKTVDKPVKIRKQGTTWVYYTYKIHKVPVKHKEAIYMQATRSPWDHKIWVNLYKDSDLC